MTSATKNSPAARSGLQRHTTSEPPWVRALLIGVALGFLSLFLFVPLVSVFSHHT
jgi:sulfate transport system permease protein